jgi:predicted amidophosphoribosyltransferase
MAKPDDLQQFEFECPKCGLQLEEWKEQCPKCGQNLSEVYSGTYRARRTRWFRAVVVFILMAILLALVHIIFRSSGP